MRIALVTETFPPEINGVAMTLDRLVGGMLSRGHHLQIVRPGRGEMDREGHRHKGLPELLVPGLPLPKYDGLHIGLPCAGRLIAAWRAEPPDVVHIATEGPLGMSALRAARVLNLPVSSSFHTNFHVYSRYYGCGFLQRLTLVLLKRFHNKTGCTMVPTRQMAQELASYGFERTCVLSRGVDTQLFDPARRSMELRKAWSVGPDDPVVLYAGRLAAEKNIGLAVEAYRKVKLKTPNARMVVVGDGPIRQKLQQENPDLHYAGYRRGEDLAAHYASADVMLFPSLTETFGNVVTEAMASGLVTLAFDTAAAHEHIRNGVSGVTVPVDRPDQFIASAVEMVARREAWKPIREAARRMAHAISWESVITDFECHLSDVREAHAAETGQPVKQTETVTA